MASTAFSQFPTSPSSPRDLLQVRNAQIQENNNKREQAAAGAWATAYRQQQDLEAVARLTSRPRDVEAPLRLTLPTSAVSMRLQGGWAVPKPFKSNRSSELLSQVGESARRIHPELANSYVRGESVPPGYAHLPLSCVCRLKAPSAT